MQRIFTDILTEFPEAGSALRKTWAKIKGTNGENQFDFLKEQASRGDENAAFAINFACFTYELIAKDPHKDEYWKNAVNELEALVNGRKPDSMYARWGRAILQAADDICTGRDMK